VSCQNRHDDQDPTSSEASLYGRETLTNSMSGRSCDGLGDRRHPRGQRPGHRHSVLPPSDGFISDLLSHQDVQSPPQPQPPPPPRLPFDPSPSASPIATFMSQLQKSASARSVEIVPDASASHGSLVSNRSPTWLSSGRLMLLASPLDIREKRFSRWEHDSSARHRKRVGNSAGRGSGIECSVSSLAMEHLLPPKGILGPPPIMGDSPVLCPIRRKSVEELGVYVNANANDDTSREVTKIKLAIGTAQQELRELGGGCSDTDDGDAEVSQKHRQSLAAIEAHSPEFFRRDAGMGAKCSGHHQRATISPHSFPTFQALGNTTLAPPSLQPRTKRHHSLACCSGYAKCLCYPPPPEIPSISRTGSEIRSSSFVHHRNGLPDYNLALQAVRDRYAMKFHGKTVDPNEPDGASGRASPSPTCRAA
jgi:hypothetical protein